MDFGSVRRVFLAPDEGGSPIVALPSPAAVQGLATAVKATARVSAAASTLGPVPRAIEGSVAELLEHLAPSALT